MLAPMPGFPSVFPAGSSVVHAGAAALAALGLGAAVLAPSLFWLLLGGVVALGIVFLVFRHLVASCVAWLLVTGLTLEMTLSDLLGPAAFQPTIAAVKAAGLGLGVLCALRYGPRLDGLNPTWGFLVMAIVGMAHGLYPGLTPADSLRSLAGSVAPFAFCFSRVPPAWTRAMIRATIWCPSLAVALGLALDIAGLRPLFIDSGGARLAALGHPAFLAGICLAATYACLIEVYRDGRRTDLTMLAVNLAALLLTGARAPLVAAAGVIGLSLLFVRSDAFPARWRLLLVLSGACALPALALLAGDLSSVRLFNLLNHDAGNLSGREYLWPAFEAAAAGSPWFGWGIGAGNVVIPPDGAVAQLLRTWAAHNEYLRVAVEGGRIGRAVLVGLFVLWVGRHTARLRPSDRWIMRLVFVAFAGHAVTDNVLISTPACVLFAFAAAVFARGADEAPGRVLGEHRFALPASRRAA